MASTQVRYNIRRIGSSDKWVLVSIVPTNYGTEATNFICEGTLDYCKRIRSVLRMDGPQD